MPKMGGDDDKEKKEESAESKAEKEAAVSLLPNSNYCIFHFTGKSCCCGEEGS